MNSEQKSIYDERSNSTFRSREMTYFWDGSKEETEYKEQIMKLVEMDPEILEDHFFDLSRPEARERCTKQIRRVAELRNAHKNDLRFRRTLLSILNSYDRSLGMRLYVHDTLFYETIYTQGTDEQFAQWKDIILETRCLGCFSMTELGHSSFLRGLETTATYDQTTQQFIINSPTLTSTKIWIGMAGQIATHTIALCQLIINNEEKGLHWFIVPLRDPESGRLLPGIAIGDVGAKMGRNGLDNGWIQFHKVSIPRGNMLMKWSHVAPDGKYKAPPNATIAYSSLIGERLLVNQATYDVVGQAVTIAIRYGAVRRQGNNNEQLLHYQSHQYNLFPVISTVYGCKFLYQYLDNYWAESLEIQKQGANGQSEFLKRSSDMHNLTAGLKSFVGWWAVEGLEQCRRGLGGHGYNAYNSIAGLIGDWGVITTGGGDNIVLAQQCARYLLSSYQRAVTGKQINGSVDYLNQYKTILNRDCPIKESSFFLKSQFQVELLEWLCVKLIDRSGSLLQCQLAQGATPENAWNENMMEIIETTKAHCVLYLLKIFIKTVEKAPNNLQPVLQRLCSLFALTNIQKLLVHFLTHNYLTNQHTSWLNKQIVTLCKEIRPDAVALVDSFNFPDWIIKAPLGAYDGDIYNKYFNTMVKAPNARGVVPYWNSIVKPMLQSKL